MCAVDLNRISWHGWPDCIQIANQQSEVVVVPAIGRVMHFGLKGDPEGAFWQNRALNGMLPEPSSGEWMNFGGDKCWPAPQSDWPLHQGREWPPPAAFDASPHEAALIDNSVLLTSPVDPNFGIQVVRHIVLDALHPVMEIRTEFRKILGEPVEVSIWTITQLRDPERVFMLLPEKPGISAGDTRLISGEPAAMHVDGRRASLARHKSQAVKIGSEAANLAWIGRNCAVRIDVERGVGEYPDGGCVTEVYTNPDPLPYVELETLGPLATMKLGDSIALTTTYTIMPRSTADPQAEARRAFLE